MPNSNNNLSHNKTKKSANCPCQEMNEKYAKGFNDDDLFIEEDEYEIVDKPRHKPNKN